uniref:Chromatin assembly factor 1 subunit A-B-like isoform X2 n=1 Tax=Saccoglossus kowalevskii TaxID=10224 RepID=A0ABM0MEC2_SACKO|nr:PREDICTED: chromatin assembly factor 1 subunit A-B-like isoform X2 [Saccoglossus kowalevskii]
MSEQQNEEETTQQEEQTEEQQEDQEEAKEGEGEGGDKKKEEKKEKPSIEDRRHRQYKKQLNKMQETLNEEKSKIVKPEYTPYTPYIWNSLTPYYETNTVQYLMDLPNEVRHGYINRNTAQGLVDPEVSHRMDIELDPVPNDIVMTPRDKSGKKDNNKKSKKKEGSTRLPKWPVVRMDDTDLNQEIDWSDVPKLERSLEPSTVQGHSKE